MPSSNSTLLKLSSWHLLRFWCIFIMRHLLDSFRRSLISSGVCAAAAAVLHRSHEAQLLSGFEQEFQSKSALIESLSSLKDAKEVPIVGGHAGLLASDGLVYKPLPAGKRGEAELRFYADVFAPDRQDRPPASLMPRFAGLHVEPGASGDAAERTFLRLEDITAPFVRPCIMDIKMGVQAWDEDATPAKIAKEACKYPTQQLVGFRLTGMRVWDRTRGMASHALAPSQPLSGTSGGYREHGRAFGYRLTQSALGTAFREYLFDGTRVRSELLPPFLEKLLGVRAWFAGQGEFRFYGSSLLFVYEGDSSAAAAAAAADAPTAAAGATCTSAAAAAVNTAPAAGRAQAASSAANVSQATAAASSTQPSPKPLLPTAAVDVRMIDFAHVFPIAAAAAHSTASTLGSSAGAASASASSGSASSRPVTTEDRDSGYLLGLDSIIHYLLVLLAEHDAPAAAHYQQRWLQQQAALPRPLMVRGHHFHHVHADGDAAALAFEPGAADAAAAALAGGATSAAAHVLAKGATLR